MVKLAQTIGASNIASSMRQQMHMLGAIVDVRQNIWSDKIDKDMIRVFPFTDISYAGAEAARSNSVLAHCLVPAIASVDVENKAKGAPMWKAPSPQSMRSANRFAPVDDRSRDDERKAPWLLHRTGMTDYLFGIDESTSIDSVAANFDADRRLEILTGEEDARDARTLGGTRAIRVVNFADEEEALDEITANPGRLTVGYVVGPRDVKLFYTDAAVAEVVRRSRNVIQALGPYRPQLMPYGMGSIGKKRERPGDEAPIDLSTGSFEAKRPTLNWTVGAVQYKAKTLTADGTLYIPGDQIPYSASRRSFKYNHVMTQLGLELLDCVSAIGIDLDKNLNHKSGEFEVNGSGLQECALQNLYASMFGVSATFTGGTGDYEVSEDMVASKIKDYLSTFFTSGHIHVDPGVFAYLNGEEYAEGGGFLDSTKMFKIRNENVSPALAYAEFIRSYFVWAAMCACLEQYFTVPLLQCHWLYTNKMKPEYVLDQMQRNIRPDVHFDGDNGMPFTLICDRLKPGETAHRIPMYFDKDGEKPNEYYGIRDPLPFGPLEEIRYAGDRPLTTVEAENKRDYTFSPIIEADASSHTTFRNGRNVNYALWPRPTHYAPGATRMGLIYGLMADNRKVSGDYFYVPSRGVFESPDSGNVLYRSLRGKPSDTQPGVVSNLLKGQLEDDKHVEYFDSQSIPDSENPQLVASASDATRNADLAKEVEQAGSDVGKLAEQFGARKGD